jgi:hypothetical protein
VNPFLFRAYAQLRVLVEGYGSSNQEKNFVAACNSLDLERFDIAWKPTGLRAGRLQRQPLRRPVPALDFLQRLTNNQ